MVNLAPFPERTRRTHAFLGSSPWMWHDEPFRHLTAEDVLLPEVYDAVRVAFRERLARGLHDEAPPSPSPPVFRRAPWGQKTYASVVTRGASGFAPFLCRAFHDLVAERFAIEATGEISIALHHHRAGDVDGRPHNDLGPGWFPDRPGDLNVHDPQVNSYPTGRAYVPGLAVHGSVRAVAILYYIDNREWEPGDGGETGLYRHASDPASSPLIRVPPRDNTLLAFECTPSSYHCFLANPGRARNALVMWLHRTREDATRLWGEEAARLWTTAKS